MLGTGSGKLATKVMMYAIVPEILAYAYNWSRAQTDDKIKEFWENEPEYIKLGYWTFYLNSEQILRIPKPHMIGAATGGLVGLLDKLTGRDQHGFDSRLAEQIVRELSVVDEGAVLGGPFKAVVENATNHDFYRNRFIVPPIQNEWSVSKIHEGGYSKGASLLGRLMETLSLMDPFKKTDMDARKVDHMVQGLFGGTGRNVLNLSDVVGNVGSALGLDIEENPDAEEQLMRGLTGIFIASPGYTGRDVQWVLGKAIENGETSADDISKLQDMIRLSSYARTPEESEFYKYMALKHAERLRSLFEYQQTFYNPQELEERRDREAGASSEEQKLQRARENVDGQTRRSGSGRRRY